MLIVYGLISLRSKQVYLSDVFFFCRLFPLLFVFGFYLDTSTYTDFFSVLVNIVPTIDMLLAILLCLIMFNFNSFESVLLLVFAFVAQYYMLHSIDLMTFYIALEAQNFAFLVLCGLPSGFSFFQGKSENSGRNSAFSVEAALKYFLLSAFSSGVILF
jgi:NADH:ubiquinone oxidoreductase subunit 2 (subunit N)